MELHLNRKIFFLVSGVTAMLLLPACNGILGGIYDEAEETGEYGFIYTDDETDSGRIYINATDYTQWHYVDLTGRSVTTLDVDDDPPQDWDFAIHRYDAKTNGGKAWESSVTAFGSLPDVTTLSEDVFVEDEWTTEQIIIDVSQMMDGIIGYTEDYYNPCLSLWLDVDTSTMPPIYTPSGKVYVLKLSDGTYAALQLANFMNDSAEKGYMTIDYLFPLSND